MSRYRVLLGTLMLTALLGAVRPASAATITLGAVGSGWYEDNGASIAGNTNYFAGWTNNGPFFEFHDFIAFDLTGVAGSITSAQLQLFNPANGYGSPDATETYALFDVSTPVATLTAATGGVAAFTDLGSGVSFGSVVVSSASNGTLVTININAAGIAALNADNGLFAFGGAVTTLSKNQNVSEGVFGFSNGAITRQLVVTTTAVPEPASMLLLGTGLVGMGARRWRNRRQRG